MAAADPPPSDSEPWRGYFKQFASDLAIGDERVEPWSGALDQLLEEERAAVLLKHFHDWTVAEIAARLGRTEDAVGGLLRRGLKKLRAAMNAVR